MSNLRSRGTAGTVEGVGNEVKGIVDDAKESVKEAFTITWGDLPGWQRDNHYILRGYRPAKASYSHCFHSVYAYLHNETVNIWTHLLGSAVFAAISAYMTGRITEYATASYGDLVVFSCFYWGAILCLGMSATYHAISCHSPETARFGNKLDYLGIVFLTVGSFIPSIYYGFYCHPNLRNLYWTMIVSLGLGCICVSVLDKFRTPAWRPYRAGMFIAFGLSGILPVMHGLRFYTLSELEDRMGLSYLVLQGAFYIVGAITYALRTPERFSPGTFDFYGSSHQIFHCFVLLAAFTQFVGLCKAYQFRHVGKQGVCSEIDM